MHRRLPLPIRGTAKLSIIRTAKHTETNDPQQTRFRRRLGRERTMVESFLIGRVIGHLDSESKEIQVCSAKITYRPVLPFPGERPRDLACVRCQRAALRARLRVVGLCKQHVRLRSIHRRQGR